MKVARPIFHSSYYQLQKARHASLIAKYRDMQQLSRAYSSAQNYGKQRNLTFDPVCIAEKLQDKLISNAVDCVLGGSMGLFALSMPRMTKDVDFNVNLTEKEISTLEHILKIENLQNRILHLKGKSTMPHFRNETLSSLWIDIDGIRVDIFLNTCSATQWVHDSAITVNNRRIISPECLAYFKLFALDKHNGRYRKDMADLETLVQCAEMDFNVVTERIKMVFGDEARQLKEWRELIAEARPLRGRASAIRRGFKKE